MHVYKCLVYWQTHVNIYSEIRLYLILILCLCAGLVDEQQKVRTISALAIAALAEAATPYGIESFDSVLKPLWKGIRQHRGKVRKQSYILKSHCLVRHRF